MFLNITEMYIFLFKKLVYWHSTIFIETIIKLIYVPGVPKKCKQKKSFPHSPATLSLSLPLILSYVIESPML